MREYLFRGKEVDSGEWIEGSLWVHLSKPYIMTTANVVSYEVDPETVGQYTGLRDCKRTAKYPEGQMIFEGDVVKHKTVFDERIYSVVFDEGAFCYFYDGIAIPFADYEYGIDSEWVEFIGNIHDNPELLKEGGEE